MTRRLSRLIRKLTPALSAGILLQTGGCTVDMDLLVSGLINQIATNLISSLVFGAFNLI